MINLSNYFPTNLGNDVLVYATGNQSISGIKNFTSRPTVNGIQVALRGEGGGTGIIGSTEDIVYITGSQIIYDVKSFQRATNINGFPFMVSGEAAFIETYHNLTLSGNNNIDLTRFSNRNAVVFLNINQNSEFNIFLPLISESIEKDKLKFKINSSEVTTPISWNVDSTSPGWVNNQIATGGFFNIVQNYGFSETLNFLVEDIESLNYSVIQSSFINSLDTISFVFLNNSWVIDDIEYKNDIPPHTHSISDIEDFPDISNLLSGNFINLEKVYNYTFTPGSGTLYSSPIERNVYVNLGFNTTSSCYINLPHPNSGISNGDRVIFNVVKNIQQANNLNIRSNKYDANAGIYLPYSNLYTLSKPQLEDVLEFWFQYPEWVIKFPPFIQDGGDGGDGGDLDGSIIDSSKTFIATGFYYSGAEYKYDKSTRPVFEGNVFINKINNQTTFGNYNHYSLNRDLPLSGQLQNLPIGIRTGNIVNLFFNRYELDSTLDSGDLNGIQPTIMIKYTGNTYPDYIIPIKNHPYYTNRALRKINFTGTFGGGNIFLEGGIDPFLGNRPIKRIPSVGQNYGGSTISGFLNNLFFPYINSELSLNNFSVSTYGYDTVNSLTFNGNLNVQDDNVTGIECLFSTTVLRAPSTPVITNNTYSISPVNFILSPPVPPSRQSTSAESFRSRILGTRSGVNFSAASNLVRLRFEPSYFYGVSSNPNLDIEVTGLTRVNPSTYLTLPGSNYNLNGRPSFINGLQFTFNNTVPNGYIYFVYPDHTNTNEFIAPWGQLATSAGITDAISLFDYTSTYTTSTISINLPTRSSVTYRIYRSALLSPINLPTTFTLNFKFA